jgi:hypothetical protein
MLEESQEQKWLLGADALRQRRSQAASIGLVHGDLCYVAYIENSYKEPAEHPHISHQEIADHKHNQTFETEAIGFSQQLGAHNWQSWGRRRRFYSRQHGCSRELGIASKHEVRRYS